MRHDFYKQTDASDLYHLTILALDSRRSASEHGRKNSLNPNRVCFNSSTVSADPGAIRFIFRSATTALLSRLDTSVFASVHVERLVFVTPLDILQEVPKVILNGKSWSRADERLLFWADAQALTICLVSKE